MKVKNCDFSLRTHHPNKNYDFLTNTFINIINNPTPLKKKFIKRNQPPLMTTPIRKEIYMRSRFINKFCKNSMKENENLYKKEKQMCCL